jgi:UDP-2,3-diacylglucosamine pyrophosphatase LpxH
MALHDRLLQALQSVADVSLVARLQDDRLSFPKDTDLRVFVPDLHLVSEKASKRYSYGTNLIDLLTKTARGLRSLRAQKTDVEEIAVYQMGDFLDLWREAGPSAGSDDASRIKDDNASLVTALLHQDLKARFLLGNHDIDLARWPSYRAWDRRYYLPFDGTPTVILLHGDAFDWVEKFPDEVNSFFVYLFGPLASPNDYGLDEMRKLAKKSHRNRKYLQSIQQPTGAPLDALADTARGLPASPFNVHEGGHEFLDAAADTCAKASRQYGLNLRLAVIGHTHHARLATRTDSNGGLFTLMDCGAWIENCVFPDGTVLPNAQIGALSANEIRLYQLGPKA